VTLNKENHTHGNNSSNMNLLQKVIIFKRWVDIILLSFLAFLTYFIISLFLILKPDFFIDMSAIGISPICLQCIIYALIFALLLSPAVRYGSFSLRSFLPSTFIKYPPFWLACILSLLAIYFLQPYISINSGKPITTVPPIIMFWAFGVVVAGVVIAVAYSKLIHWHTSSCDKYQANNITKTYQSITEDPNALLQWIEEEKPIQTNDQDILSYKQFAERIYIVLQQPKITITVVGSYGAGKSSILNMVKNYLRPSSNDSTLSHSLITCDVCGWGLQKGSAAETVLKQVIQTCTKHVDCLGLSNLPVQYGESIGHISTWSKALSGLFSHSYDPMVTLERMDKVLWAMDKRVVIFFEDLDRNWQGNDYWIEVVSLLDRLKKLDRVSFVLAITGTNKIGDIINRISDHIEIVPRLSLDHVCKIYPTFMRLCFQQYKDIIFNKGESRYHRIVATDLLLQDQKSDLLNMEADIENAMLHDQISDLSYKNLGDALAPVVELLENPRNLKHVLRRTYHAWAFLHGEIEFDHLLFANVLRVAEPAVFNFIHNRLPDIHWLQEARQEEDAKRTREKLQKELSEITKDNLPLHDNIEKLVCFLFPYWKHSPVYRAPMIQGFSDIRATDYWNRMIREKRDEGEISDQVFAKAITEWKQNRDLSAYKGFSLAQAMGEISGFPKKIEQFSEELLDALDVRILISQFFDYVFCKKGVHSFYVPGMTELIRLTHEKYYPEHGQWFIDEVSKLFSIDLSIAHEVINNFLVISEHTEVKRICSSLIENAKSIYFDREIFIKAIESSSDSVVSFISKLNKIYVSHGGEQFNSAKLKWLADLLLETANTHSSIVIPQILELAVAKKMESFDTSWCLNSKFIKSIFQERQREVMLLLSNIKINKVEEKLRQRGAAAKESASNWLLENTENIDAPLVD
jgi:hypothetical protein